IFAYSERKNTIAARKYPDDVPAAVKSDRVTRLVDLQKRIATELNQRLVGSTVEALVEGDSKRSHDQWMGRTDTNVTVVWQKSEAIVSPGLIVPVRIERASATTLYGKTS
ncbi:MAG TPA: TRAM domain-containing protein, partial [Nitrospiraceae bacterium]|nr:TRAM domain-containing protein [Nitrospiraceae bacterium]